MAGKESPPVYVTRKVFTAPGVWGLPQALGQASPVPGLESEDEGSGSGASSFLGCFFFFLTSNLTGSLGVFPLPRFLKFPFL